MLLRRRGVHAGRRLPLSAAAARVAILGTDIDKRMVARAQNASFSEDDARSAPAEKLNAAFERVDDGWRARRALRAMTRFEVGDLLKVTPRPGSYDLILCRNTVIYFSEPIRDALHVRAWQRACAAAAIWSSARPNGSRSAGARAHDDQALHLPESLNGHLRVHADVPRGVARAPAGAESRRRARSRRTRPIARRSTRSSGSRTRSRG